MSIDLRDTLDAARAIALQAGAILRAAAFEPRTIAYKGAIDLVTQFDRQSEAIIVGELRKQFPQHAIVGEEGGSGAPIGSGYCWYVDPIDGTTNFAHGLPHYAVSIGLAGPDGVPIVGVVYDPSRDECFSALRGGGAFVNGRPIRVSVTREVGRSLISSGYPYDKWTTPNNNNKEWEAFVLRTQGMLSLGSAALDFCYVAAGRLDGYWEPRLQAWDLMAGGLLVQEAGGRISNYGGTMDGVWQGKGVVASNGLLHDPILNILVMKDKAPLPGA